MESLTAKVDLFRRLHEGPRMLVLPNAWDAASAVAFANAGFAAIATTSGGVAAALGYDDHEGTPADEMFAAVARIARAVPIPVTADLEAGYRLPPEEVARRTLATGVAGLNLEDSIHQESGKLVDAERQAEWLAAFKNAARAGGVDIVLNARVDVFIRGVGSPGEQLADGVRRGALYRAAGADCLYPIGLGDVTMIAEFVQGVGCPVNIMVRRGGVPLSHLAAVGVRRVSYATSLFRETMTMVQRMASDLQTNLENELGA